MENETVTPSNPQIAAEQLHRYVAHMLVQEDKTPTQVKKILMAQGIDEQVALSIVRTVEDQAEQARRAKAKRDILFGGLWTVGGTALTFANIGYIFWGAIVFGFIQMIRGFSNL